MQSVVLIGMMGVGKTSVGRHLAALLEREFVDTDAQVQHKLGRSIDSLFKTFGESAFRDHEAIVIESQPAGNYVISTGGGAVVRESNWSHLQTIGVTVYLKASLELLKSRLERGRHKRPLLAGDDWEAVLASKLNEREPLYERAQVVFRVNEEDSLDTAHRLAETLLEGGYL